MSNVVGGIKFDDVVGKILGHGISQGAMTAAQGGKFSHGFFSAVFTAGFAPGIMQTTKSGFGRVVASSVIGGTASVLGGGKFANGAVTGAYVMMFNHMRHPEDKDKKKNDPYYRPEEGDKAPLVKGIYKSSLKNLGTKIRNWESKNLDGRTNGGKTPKIVQIITNVITPQVQLINGIKTFMTGIDIYNQPVYPQYAPGAWNIFAATLDIVGGLSGMGILIDVVTPIAFDLVSTPPQNTIE